jgi:hypothetical protein
MNANPTGDCREARIGSGDGARLFFCRKRMPPGKIRTPDSKLTGSVVPFVRCSISRSAGRSGGTIRLPRSSATPQPRGSASSTLRRLAGFPRSFSCRTGQPNDIATATGLVIQICGVVKEAYLEAQADAQAAKAAQPAPAPTGFLHSSALGRSGWLFRRMLALRSSIAPRDRRLRGRCRTGACGHSQAQGRSQGASATLRDFRVESGMRRIADIWTRRNL